jgi:uncharacterized protein YjiK
MKIPVKYILIGFLSLFLVCSCSGKKKGNDQKTDSEKDKKDKTEEVKKDENKSSSGGSLSSYDITSSSPQTIELSSDLMEISGITFTPDNRLFAHGDEYADIFEIDPVTGKIIKKFTLGSLLAVKGDFEDIAYVKDRFFLLESKGKLYEFKEGSNGEFVEYKTYKTFLNEKNDVEGLCYDNESNSLLLACKGSGGKELGKDKAVYTFSLDNMELEETPRFVISYKDIKNNTVEGKFNPSGIAKNPVSGTFFIIAARGNTIIEVSKTGEILDQADLPENVHKQAEGIAFKSDGTLYISNEGRGKIPVIAVYKMK